MSGNFFNIHGRNFFINVSDIKFAFSMSFILVNFLILSIKHEKYKNHSPITHPPNYLNHIYIYIYIYSKMLHFGYAS